MNKRFALTTVFFVVLIDLMGFGIVLPLLPFYAEKFGVSAVAIGLLYTVYSLAQLIFSPIWGSLSDRFGRKPIMIISTLGSTASYILFGFSSSFVVLFLSRLLAGSMGGNISAAQACVADITSPEDRAKGMGLIGAAFGIGFVVGPAIATFFVHSVAFIAAGLSFTSFLMVCFALPETRQAAQASDDARVVRSSIFSIQFWKSLKGEGDSKSLLPHLFAGAFLLALGQSSLYSAFPLFCKSRLGLSPQKVAMQFVAMGLIAIFIQGGLIRVLLKKFSEKSLFLTGSALMILGMALIPWASSEKSLMLFLGIMSVGASLNGPTLTSLISKNSSQNQIGQTMGSAQGASALGRVVGPTWGGFLLGVSYFAPFLLTSIVLISTIFIGLELIQNPA